MKNVNYFKLGAFILVALVVGFGGIFYLGLKEKFEDKVDFVTYFDQSVQGLDVGSSVKASGVTIGKVTKVSLVRGQAGIVEVLMSVEDNILTAEQELGMTEKEIRNHYRKYIEDAVDRGVRCSLTFQGITGLKYVELDIIDETKVETVQLDFDVKELYIPATRSTLENTMNSFDQAITRIASVDYKQLAQNIDSLVVSVRDITESDEMKSILQETSGTMAELRKSLVTVNRFGKNDLPVLTQDWMATTTKLRSLLEVTETEIVKANISETTQEFKASAGKIGTLSDEVKVEVKKVSATLNDNLVVINKLMTELSPSLQNTVKQAGAAGESVVLLRADLSESLEKLNRALDSIRQLSDFLERNPSAVLRGKQ